MIEIQIDPIVLSKLKESFPSPPNAAQKALSKYIAVFESILNKAMMIGRSRYEILFNFYSLNLRQLSQKSPQIGEGKKRVHAWLIENDLLFYDVIERGNNLTGLVSQVKLSDLVTIKNHSNSLAYSLNNATTDAEIDEILIGKPSRNHDVFIHLYPDFYVYQTEEQLAAVYDQIPIDISSLKAYIFWLNTKADLFSIHSIQDRTTKAQQILSVALHTNGFYYQRKKNSEFGRIYYEGVSVQNVPKDLRAAMMGDCWELDLRSSVIAFKLGYAQAFTLEKFQGINYRLLFSSSLAYVQERNFFVNILRRQVFEDDKAISVELQTKLIKDAFTAISFGARANSAGWRLVNGTWKNPALKNIFKNAEWHKKFLANSDVCSFIAEQEMLDNYFHEQVKEQAPELLELDVLKVGKRLSKSKLISYIYQHQETKMMNFVRAHLISIGKPAVASIHDAVIVKKELVNGQLADLNWTLRKEFGNELLLLRQKGIGGYKRYRIEPEVDFPVPTVEDLLKRLGYKTIEDMYSIH